MSLTLCNLIEETYNNYDGTKDYPSILLNILKEKQLWPALKIKKFKNDKNLCLIHNSYKTDIREEFKVLYDECRSVILDFTRSIGNNVVISYTNSIPIRQSINDYTTNIYKPTDKSYIAMDGTLISVYYHNNKWYFGSSCCPDINGSKFSHPTKTHGYMLDEVLYEMFKNKVDINDPNISLTLRTLFTSNLSPLFSYEFVLIHHENIHIIDYTNILGLNYKYLFHINTKNRITLNEENLDVKPLEYLGIKYPLKFNTPEDAIQYLNMNEGSIIIKQEGKLYKISNDKIHHVEEVNANNYNKWYNLFYVYMLQKPNYNINEYIQEFLINQSEYNNGYMEINTIFMVIKSIIYNLYISTTNYYPKYNRFKINLDIDKKLSPVIRFHLAQLRQKQVSIYKKAIITETEVFNYLCHSNNIKNIKKIITHISLNGKLYDLPEQITELFINMNNKLLF
jgi:hypothetical protein